MDKYSMELGANVTREATGDKAEDVGGNTDESSSNSNDYNDMCHDGKGSKSDNNID
jgi:hypothetical protein